jgi:hypothetical protein
MRWKLRQAVKVVNRVLSSLHLTKHPEKTFIGRIEKGFEFLGYAFSPERLSVATKTLANFVARLRQLYEREPGEASASSRLGDYVHDWTRWVLAGIPSGWQERGLHAVRSFRLASLTCCQLQLCHF